MKKVITLIIISIITNVWAENPISTEKWETTNGAQVVFHKASEIPMLDIVVAFKAGSAYDGQNFGLSALTTDLLNQGNGMHDANTIANLLADTGAQYNAETSRDMAVFSLRTLTSIQELNSATDTFALIINNPNFPTNAFKREKEQQLVAIHHSKDSPNEVANQAFFAALYKNHPYAHPVSGHYAQVQNIRLQDVHDFYRKYFFGRNAFIIIVGSIESFAAHKLAEKVMHRLPRGKKLAPIIEANPLNKNENRVIEFPSSQTILRLGQLGITHHDPDYFPMFVGNYILGGSPLTSNLGLELREKRGLTYNAFSQLLAMPGVGPFIIGLSTKGAQADKALELTQNILTTFIKQGPSPKELAAAKKFLTGNFKLSLASNRNIAEVLLKIAFYNLPDDYLDNYLENIDKVEVPQIKSAFTKHINPERLLKVRVGT